MTAIDDLVAITTRRAAPRRIDSHPLTKAGKPLSDVMCDDCVPVVHRSEWDRDDGGVTVVVNVAHASTCPTSRAMLTAGQPVVLSGGAAIPGILFREVVDVGVPDDLFSQHPGDEEPDVGDVP